MAKVSGLLLNGSGRYFMQRAIAFYNIACCPDVLTAGSQFLFRGTMQNVGTEPAGNYIHLYNLNFDE